MFSIRNYVTENANIIFLNLFSEKLIIANDNKTSFKNLL